VLNIQVAEEEIMKEPTKKLVSLTKRYNKAKKAFHENVRGYLRTADLMEPEAFWQHLDYFAKEIQSRKNYGGDAVKEASHNTILHIRQRYADTDNEVSGWAQAACFLATYRMFVDKLRGECYEMLGVCKGDDGYDDWTDALPLAGKGVVEGILSSKLDTYNEVDEAVNEVRPALCYAIMNGENYIRTKFERELVKHFGYVVNQMED
jgi:hypothetical protein